ncbi:HNH endonuclease [Lysobacter enzymogenes]|uniref:HNH endonuclease n=1 Tax=Lysobacter enzymogenes TaxID=69 RepID=UPI0018E9789C|nr:HNH endonuclease [Lysobacter enzymogenes]UZW61176.1 HNH endonuclease [Lysobacter enzymogenes]
MEVTPRLLRLATAREITPDADPPTHQQQTILLCAFIGHHLLMRYWWVNQKQTYGHEVPGGYLWSPKRKSNGHRNPFYEYMREVAPGDVVFSFADGGVKAIGLIASHAYEAPKPHEFGQVGAYWEQIGWRVDVRFHELPAALRPSEHMAQLAPLLPQRYAPLQANGHGLQSIYLTLLPESFALALADLIGRPAHSIIQGRRIADAPAKPVGQGLIEWEEHQMAELQASTELAETTKQAVIQARRGQGLFKQRVMEIEIRCRLTGVDRVEHLRASHCKPWRDASNSERLDGENGLLLTPDADHLFDRGFLSFEDSGKVLISPVAHRPSLKRMGLDPDGFAATSAFSSGQRVYLEYHRANVFLQARLST